MALDVALILLIVVTSYHEVDCSGVWPQELPIPFFQATSPVEVDDQNSAKIVKSSHFSHKYKLGYKILLLCVAEGRPLPNVVWYRDGQELRLTKNSHISETTQRDGSLKSKLEIDPASVGNQGVYTCVASNPGAFDHRSFRTEYEL